MSKPKLTLEVIRGLRFAVEYAAGTLGFRDGPQTRYDDASHHLSVALEWLDRADANLSEKLEKQARKAGSSVARCVCAQCLAGMSDSEAKAAMLARAESAFDGQPELLEELARRSRERHGLS
jgi:hypothetical protein